MREAAAAAPYEFIEIVVNDRKYGGGGIHNLYATVSADNAFAPYVFVHEFGHHFAGLADEYYTSPVAYETRGRAARAVGAERDRGSARRRKWTDLVDAGHAAAHAVAEGRRSRPAQKDYQAQRRQIRAEKRPEAEMEALFREERERSTARAARGPARARGGRLRGRDVRGDRATTGRRPTASCSRATRSASARSAGARSSA